MYLLETLHMALSSTIDFFATMGQLFEALEANSVEQAILFSYERMNDTEAANIAQGISANRLLRRLELYNFGWGMSLNGVQTIGNALGSSSALMSVKISASKIGSLGAEAIAIGLASNSCLEELVLFNCGISELGARAFAAALVHNTTLRVLDLGRNSIGDLGACALADTLATNSALTELSLGGNTIANMGGNALANALKSKNTTLCALQMEGNYIQNEARLIFAEAVRENTILSLLNISPHHWALGMDHVKVLIEMGTAIRDTRRKHMMVLDGMSLCNVWKELGLPMRCRMWTNTQIIGMWYQREKMEAFGMGLHCR